MSSILIVVLKVSCIVATLCIAIVLWKTGELFNENANERVRSVLSWNMLIGFVFLLVLVLKLMGM